MDSIVSIVSIVAPSPAPRSARHPMAFRAAGASLIEVMVAVCVCSIGLLGSAGLMLVSIKDNQGALEDTQAALAAQALIESMHVNPHAVRVGGYDGTYAARGAAAPSDCRLHACSASDAAAYDRARFGRMLDASLPDSSAQLKCDAGSGSSAASVCRLQIDWSQRGLQPAQDAIPQSLVWIFAS